MKQLWYRITQFIETNCTAARIKVINQAVTDPPYDWEYLLRLEKAKLQEMLNYFKSMSHTFDHDNDIKWINICIKLIDIIVEGNIFDTPEEVGKYVNTRNMKRFYHLGKGVTWDKVEEQVKRWPNDLRILKAENLYYEIRKEYTRSWWD